MKDKISCFTSDSNIFNKSYGQWTVRWWKWALSTPRSKNPVLDKTGENHAVNQPSSDVWFLAGVFGDEEKYHPTRKIKLPEGLSILFPVLNCEANSIEYPHLKNDNDLIKHVSDDVGTVIKKDCYINDIKVIPERVKSDPVIFEFIIPKDNVLGVEGGQVVRASADGYWVFLSSLTKGKYLIDFEGSCEYGRLSSGAKYELEII